MMRDGQFILSLAIMGRAHPAMLIAARATTNHKVCGACVSKGSGCSGSSGAGRGISGRLALDFDSVGHGRDKPQMRRD
jgi:hypothetical protein